MPPAPFDRTRLKEVLYRLYAIAGGERRLLRRLRANHRVVILNLHRISPHANPFWNPLHPRIFEELLKFLQSEFEFARLDEIGKGNGTRPQAVLSFDDGYRDFVEYALPLLRKYGASANQNVIPECVRTGLPIWNVRLYDFLNSAPRASIDRVALPGFDVRLAGDSAQAKTRYGLALGRYLKMRPQAERAGMMESIDTLISAVPATATTRMLNIDEVRQIAREGCDVGLHSFSHESMGFESDAFFAQDFARSADFFRDQLQLPLTIYAFPNGSYRQAQIDFLLRNGIAHVLLVEEKIDSGSSNVHPRLTIHGGSAAEARFQALGQRARGVM